jgi:hypothetical protein
MLPVCEVFVSAGLGDILAGLGSAMRAYLHLLAFGHV